MSNKGSVLLEGMMFFVIIFIFTVFFGITAYKIIITGQLHTIKNDLYLINRNVLLSLQRDSMGEDVNMFYEKDVKKNIIDEIKMQWNVDVSEVAEGGFIKKVEVCSAKIVNDYNKMYIESILNIQLRPIIFQSILKDKLTFRTKESVKVEKMKGWSHE